MLGTRMVPLWSGFPFFSNSHGNSFSVVVAYMYGSADRQPLGGAVLLSAAKRCPLWLSILPAASLWKAKICGATTIVAIFFGMLRGLARAGKADRQSDPGM
jgi:hypothetical protein